MKKLTLLLMALLPLCLFAQAASLGLGGSYLQRAGGIYANYWNPALNFGEEDYLYQINIMDLSLMAGNNVVSAQRWNKVNGDSLTQGDKDYILDNINGSMRVFAHMDMVLAGMSWQDNSLTLGAHATAQGRVDKQYLDLVFNGNAEHYGRKYKFKDKDNNAGALAYADLTWGKGGWLVNDWFTFMRDRADIPPVRAGLAVSMLYGGIIYQTVDYKGSLSTDDDEGLNIVQKVKTRMGTNGLGFKSRLGLSSQLNNDLSAGLALDNLAGFITWLGHCENGYYGLRADSLYASDIDEDYLVQTDSTRNCGSFTTWLAPSLQLGFLYQIPLLESSASLDVKQPLASRHYQLNSTEVSLGWEYRLLSSLPLRFGVGLPNSDEPWRFSYGIGWDGPHWSMEFGVQALDSILPNENATGMGYALNTMLKF